MLAKRIIACLDIKEGRVVKGTNFFDLKDAGDPVECASLYDQQGIDELCFLDIMATVDNRNLLYKVLNETANCVSAPLTVGGGVNKLDDLKALLANGADKVSINSGLFKNPKLVDKAANSVGSQCVVAAIDAKFNQEKSFYEVYSHGGRKAMGRDAIEWAKELEDRGAGEILLTSIDRDGTQIGFNIDLTAKISNSVNIPVVASGGAGGVEAFLEVFNKTNCDAALAAGIFHFGKVLVPDLKAFLIKQGLNIRPC